MKHRPDFFICFPLKTVESFAALALIAHKRKGVIVYDYELNKFPLELKALQTTPPYPALVDGDCIVVGGINALVNHMDRRYPEPAVYFGSYDASSARYSTAQTLKYSLDIIGYLTFFGDAALAKQKTLEMLSSLEDCAQQLLTTRQPEKMELFDLYLLGYLLFCDFYAIDLSLSSYPELNNYCLFLKSTDSFTRSLNALETRHDIVRFYQTDEYSHSDALAGMGFTRELLKIKGLI